MKTQTVSVGLILLCLLGCDKKARNASDQTGQQPSQSQALLNKPGSDYERQVKEYDEQAARQEAVFAQQLAQYNEQTKKAEALLKAQEDEQKKYRDMMAKQEVLLKQEEDSAARWAKILTTWEKQQEQYQKYLDSLVK